MHNRFFVDSEISEDKVILNDSAQIHQILRVLRLKEGSDVVLLDNTGFEHIAVIEVTAKNEIVFKILEKRESEAESEVELSLFQGLLKKDKMEWIFEKGTELGVSRFVPVFAKHCVKTDLNFERARKIIREAAEQSGRAKLPELLEISDFEKALGFRAEKDEMNFILDPAGKVPLKNFICQNKLPEKINVFVGPEGGFAAEELAAAEKSGFKIVSLGKRILRAETAAIAACGLLVI